MKQKGNDYKITAVKYYLNNNNTMNNTCKIFNCKKPSLHRWIQLYKTKQNLQRKPRTAISYKIKNEQGKTALHIIDKNEQITMDELLFDIKQKYPTFNITRQHLGRVIRINNRTRKRTRHQHFPKERRKQPTDKNKELHLCTFKTPII